MALVARQIEETILRLTQRRISNLQVELEAEKVILRGQTDSFYLKSLAQQGVREILPQIRLQNAISVA